jgi:hypothetical protein
VISGPSSIYPPPFCLFASCMLLFVLS